MGLIFHPVRYYGYLTGTNLKQKSLALEKSKGGNFKIYPAPESPELLLGDEGAQPYRAFGAGFRSRTASGGSPVLLGRGASLESRLSQSVGPCSKTACLGAKTKSNGIII